MLITFENAIKEINKRNMPLIEKLEEIIDEAILNSTGKFPVNVDSKIIGLNSSIIETCLDKYRNHGWIAKYISDQRDGDYISIHPKKNQNTEQIKNNHDSLGLYENR